MATAPALTKSLKTLLSDTVTFYFMAHGFHWNVEGSDFSQYHGLFAEIYEDAYTMIDPVAENIRKLDDYAPFNLQKFIDLRTLEFKEVSPNPKAMSTALLKANEALITQLNASFKEATKADQQGIANFLSERVDSQMKWSWQLRASVK
jgi:starvation-inducible DNA-binding protein